MHIALINNKDAILAIIICAVFFRLTVCLSNEMKT